MDKEYFDSLRAIEQADVTCLVIGTITEMIKEQFTFAKATAFVELLKERLGQMDVVPRSMVESRTGICGTEEEK
jgi:hypothetical protein